MNSKRKLTGHDWAALIIGVPTLAVILFCVLVTIFVG